MLGLIDNHIDSKILTNSPKRADRISHGSQSLWQVNDAFRLFGGNELSAVGLSLVSLAQPREFLYQLLKGVDQLIDQNVRAVCLPMAFASPSPLLEEIANACHERNMLLIAPAGNKGQGRIMYPGAYYHVLCVGAADISGGVASYSGSLRNKQGQCLKPEVLAKGNLTVQGESISEGTSVACAEVAGLAASILEANPELTTSDLKKSIYDHCSFHSGSRYGVLDGRSAKEPGNNFVAGVNDESPDHSGLEAGWVDPVLRGEYKRARNLGRSLKALVSISGEEELPTNQRLINDPLVHTCEKFNHLKVVYIEADPAFFEVLFARPDLAWASSVDLNYFDI